MLRFDNYRDSLAYWVFSTAHALERVVNDDLAPMGMTYRQAEVLGWLALEENSTLSQAELARRMRISAPTLGGIVNRMERDGWLLRETCPQDRRKILLRPTEQVQPYWERLLQQEQQLRQRATEGLSTQQVRQLLELLAIVHENLNRESERKGQDQHDG